VSVEDSSEVENSGYKVYNQSTKINFSYGVLELSKDTFER